jgi:DNA-binding LytR/AlgR family response regulator
MIENLKMDSCSLISFSNSSELLKFAENNKFDILITDISMPTINGIEIAEKIFQINPDVQFIFVSAYTKYIEDVFGVIKPTFYLLKPVNTEKLKQAISSAIKEIETKNMTINFISKNKTVRIKYKCIVYVESQGRKVIFHQENRETEEIISKLSHIEDKFPNNFIRCHQSFLVNMDKIQSIKNNKIFLFSGEIIPVPSDKYKSVKDRIMRYWGENL